MNRFTGVVLGSVCVVITAGCSSSVDSSRFKSYKELVEQNASPTDNKPPADAKTDTPTGSDMASENVALAPNPTEVAPVVSPVSALAPANVVDGTSTAAVVKAFGGTAANASVTEATTSAKTPAEPKPEGIQLLVPQREFKTEGPQNALRVSYDDLDLLKVLNMEPVPEDALKHFPSWLKALDGQRVRLRGFMYPTFQATGIDQFVLARDNQICCFGRNPKVYDLVSVQMRDNVTTDYIQNRPFDVVGTFRIDLLAEGGKPMGLYWLEDSVVINK